MISFRNDYSEGAHPKVLAALEKNNLVTTRGKGITREALQEFIATLAIPEAEKARLMDMTPGSYIGKAAELAKRI